MKPGYYYIAKPKLPIADYQIKKQNQIYLKHKSDAKIS